MLTMSTRPHWTILIGKCYFPSETEDSVFGALISVCLRRKITPTILILLLLRREVGKEKVEGMTDGREGRKTWGIWRGIAPLLLRGGGRRARRHWRLANLRCNDRLAMTNNAAY